MLARKISLVLVFGYFLLGTLLIVNPWWKEYKGAGVSLNYPASWLVKDANNPDFVRSTSDPFNGFDISDILGSVKISVMRELASKEGADYFDDPEGGYYAIYKEGQLDFKANDNFRMDGKRAIFASFTWRLGGDNEEIYWIKGREYIYYVFVTFSNKNVVNGLFNLSKITSDKIIQSMHFE